MPILKGSASDFTSTVKGSAEVNAAVGGAVAKGGNSNPPRSLGAIAAIVTQSAVAKSSGLQPTRFRVLASTPAPAPAPAPAAPTFNSLSLTNDGGSDAFLARYTADGRLNWATKLAATGNYGVEESVNGIVFDDNGNAYVAGDYLGTLKLFNQDGTSFATQLAGGATNVASMFIAKYNSIGVVQWAARITATAGYPTLYSITIDPSGNVYVGGEYTAGTITIYSKDGTPLKTMTTSGSYDGFLVKYSKDGIAQWAATINSADMEQLSSLKADTSGNIYVAGFFGGTSVSIYNEDGSSFGSLSNPIGNYVAAYLVKYNTNGVVQWSARLRGANGQVSGNKIALDSSGNIYLTSGVQGKIDVYNKNDTLVFSVNAGSMGSDSIVVKYDSSGIPQWGFVSVASPTSTFDFPYGIAVDSLGNIYITGVYRADTKIFSITGTSFATIPNSGQTNDDVYIIKYNSSGIAQWASYLSASGIDTPTNIAVDSSGNVYVCGFFRSSSLAIYNKDTTQFGSLTNPGATEADGFLVKYNTSGMAQWASRVGSATVNKDRIMSLNIDPQGNTYIGGSYVSNPLTIYSQGL